MRLPRMTTRWWMVAVPAVACVLWWAAIRQRGCPNCREYSSLVTCVRLGGCPQCGLTY
jgi:hypothetical protein